MCDVCQCWLLALVSSQSLFSNQMNCQMNYIKLEGGLRSNHKSSSLSNWSLSFEQLIGKCFNVVKTSSSQNVCTITLFQAFFLIVRRFIKLTYFHAQVHVQEHGSWLELSSHYSTVYFTTLWVKFIFANPLVSGLPHLDTLPIDSWSSHLLWYVLSSEHTWTLDAM